MQVVVGQPVTAADGKVSYTLETSTQLPQYGDAKRGAGGAICTLRRFSDLEYVHSVLLAKDPRLPPLPGKSAVTSLFSSTKSLVEERRVAFQSILSYIAADATLRVRSDVASFLGASPFPAKPKAVAQESAPEVAPVVYKDNPLEEALSALNVVEKPKPAPAASPSPAAKPAAPKPAPAPSAPRPGGFTPFGSAGTQTRTYESSGEGVRDAIKGRDLPAVVRLLESGQSPNYVDAQGMSLLHVACLFDAGDIAAALLERGADAAARNGQGETALDCAPPALAHKLRQKIQTA